MLPAEALDRKLPGVQPAAQLLLTALVMAALSRAENKACRHKRTACRCVCQKFTRSAAPAEHAAKAVHLGANAAKGLSINHPKLQLVQCNTALEC